MNAHRSSWWKQLQAKHLLLGHWHPSNKPHNLSQQRNILFSLPLFFFVVVGVVPTLGEPTYRSSSRAKCQKATKTHEGKGNDFCPIRQLPSQLPSLRRGLLPTPSPPSPDSCVAASYVFCCHGRTVLILFLRISVIIGYCLHHGLHLRIRRMDCIIPCILTTVLTNNTSQ